LLPFAFHTMRTAIGLLVGWAGSVYGACPSLCSGHGDCGAHDVCSCWDFWTGADCSLRKCPSGVSWQTASDEQLRDGATPNYPEGFRSYAECSDRGICDQTVGQCRCFDGFEGKGCRRSSCSNNCNGHGRCVFDAEIDRENYWNDGLLHNQKQYWNGYKTQQCICDRGWWGYDCSQRLCPEGQKGAADESCSGDFIDDVQMVTLTFSDLSITAAKDIEQFFTLEFTDMFSGRYTTRPISFWDDPRAVQEALISLPDNTIPNVEVSKVFPLAGFSATPNAPGKWSSQAGTGDQCAVMYNDVFAATTCESDANCYARYPSLGINTFCDFELSTEDGMGRCVETEAECVFTGAGAEFETDPPCGAGFEPDGVYQVPTTSATLNPGASDSVFYWGRKLTATESACQVGTFDDEDPVFARACTTNADCKPCSGWTNVVAGSCVADRCSYDTSLYTPFVTSMDSGSCHVASFLVVLSHSSTPGEQELFNCNVGSHTNFDGASPRFPSGKLRCDVTRVSKNKWKSSTSAQQLCINEGDNGFLGTFEDYDDSSLTCQNGDANSVSYGLDEFNALVSETNYVLEVAEMVDTTFTTPGVGLFEDTVFIDAHESFIPSSPCSAQGDCDVTTGSCSCASGFEGDACQELTKFS